MALSEVFAGSDTFTTTEESIFNNTSATTAQSVTDDGIYQVFLDLNALADGDVYIVRGKEKCRSGDTQRVFLYEQLTHDPGASELWVSPPFQLMHGSDFTLQKSAGTDRAIAWSVRKVA
jgi:hypothetical protein